MGASITGWGAALPVEALPNSVLAARLGVTEQWIRERTGIRSRHIARDGETTSSLSTEAALRAVDRAGVSCEDIDMVMVATSTPDYQLPATASIVQHGLGCSNAGAFDVNAACSGFLYALAQAEAFIGSGLCSTVVVCGADVLSPITDQTDPRSCVLFGDGAGAVVVERSDTSSLGPFVFRSEGGLPQHLYVNADERLIRMNGREVYRRAVDAMSDIVLETLAVAGIDLDQVDFLVAHQANGRILQAVGKRLGLDSSKVAVHIEDVGNTSAASIPLALVDAAENGRLQPGSRVALAAFGAGFTWGGGMVTWRGTPGQGALHDAPAVAGISVRAGHRDVPALAGTVGHVLERM